MSLLPISPNRVCQFFDICQVARPHSKGFAELFQSRGGGPVLTVFQMGNLYVVDAGRCGELLLCQVLFQPGVSEFLWEPDQGTPRAGSTQEVGRLQFLAKAMKKLYMFILVFS